MPRGRQKFLTQVELNEIIENWSDDENELGERPVEIPIVVVPPSSVDEQSDNEELDDNIQVTHDENVMPREIAGSYELDMDVESESDDEMEIDEPTISSRVRGKNNSKRVKPTSSQVCGKNNSKWVKPKNVVFDKQPFDDDLITQKKLNENLGMVPYTFCCIYANYIHL